MDKKQSEPVAWMMKYKNKNVNLSFNKFQLEADNTDYFNIPLYTTPQTKPLSDEEILIEAKYQPNLGYYLACEFDVLDFARAIEAKVRGEK